MANSRRNGFIGIAFFLQSFTGWLIPAPVSADGSFFAIDFAITPSDEIRNEILTTAFAWLCYEQLTGKRLECGVRYEHFGLSADPARVACVIDGSGGVPSDTCADGGHTHANPERPLLYRDDQGGAHAIAFPGDSNPAPLAATGTTFGPPNLAPFADPYFLHDQPQVAGIYTWESTATAPPGYVWSDRIRFTRDTVKAVGTTNVGVEDLRWLPDPGAGDDYIKVRGGPGRTVGTDPYHVDAVAHFGTPLSLQYIPLLATNYSIYRGRRLSVNDMSLPKGGVFEARGDWEETSFDWKSPHKGHRAGRDVDINRDGLRCKVDPSLQQVVDQLLKPPAHRQDSALYCEPDGLKHIDIDEFLDQEVDV